MQTSPQKIRETLKALPPFQRDQVSANYIGHLVEWNVFFSSVKSSSKKMSRLFLVDADVEFGGSFITCDADLSIYPQFKIMNEKEKFLVKGKIKEISSLAFELEECEFVFPNGHDTSSIKSQAKNSAAQTPSINNSPGAILIQKSPGATVSPDSSSQREAKPTKTDSWIKQIIIGIIIGIVLIYFAFSFNLNGNKSETSTHQSIGNTPTVLPSDF